MTTIVTMGGTYEVGPRPFPSTTLTRIEGPSRGIVPLLSMSGELRAATYEAMVRSQPWLFAAVRTLVKGMMRVPLKVYSGEEATERDRVKAHPLPRLIARPYPRARRQQMMMQFAWDYYVHGKAMLLLVSPREGDPPSEMWPVPWKFVQEIKDEWGVIGYNVCLGGVQHPVSLSQACVIEYMLGTSPIESLRRTLALEDASMEWQGASLAQGVTPRAVFQTKDAPRKGDDQQKLRAELDKLYAGQANAGRYALLGGDWTVTEMGVTAVDLALVEQRRLSREEVAAAYGITPPLIGILDRATFNNVEELVRQFYGLTMAPDLENIAGGFQAQVVDPVPAWDGLFVEFDTDVVLKPDPLKRGQMHLLMQQSATNSTNERRAYENLKPIGDPLDPANPANIPNRPLNMAPVTAPYDSSAPAPAPTAPAGASGLTDQLVIEALRAGAPTRPDVPKED